MKAFFKEHYLLATKIKIFTLAKRSVNFEKVLKCAAGMKKFKTFVLKLNHYFLDMKIQDRFKVKTFF